MQTEKRCPRCSETKPIIDFGKNKSRNDGRQPWCKDCQAAWKREKYKIDPEFREKEKHYTAKWKKENEERWKEYQNNYNKTERKRSILKTYGLTIEQWEALIVGGCQICGKFEKLVVDHDHTTGVIRGCLCDWCNVGLARFNDDVKLLQKAIAYLFGASDISG